MRINQAFIFLLAVTLAGVVQAGKQDFTPETKIKKTVKENGGIVYEKSGFEIKDTKKPKSVEVKAPQKNIPPKVDIYYASWDPYSNKAIMFFRDNHIVVNAYDIDLVPAAAERKKKLDPAFGGIPLVIINGVMIRGVNEKLYQDALSIKPPQ